ncbi:MAG: site-specific integrase [Eggerthellaceae bacterium]|nr:site-specific integrase [Eggerthellaceae bacterium]MBQ9069559.1 site-specific integrase [Eggerthellaceae bacterium]
MKYTTRGIRRRGDTDKWEVILTHKDPLTGELLPSYHTIVAPTEKQARKKRDELIVKLELEGGAVGANITLSEFMLTYLDVREKDGTLEPSTVRGYRGDAKQILKYIGDVQLGSLTIPDVSKWMSDMTADGYAPKTCSKAFRLLKMALKWAEAQDLITKNPCDYCKPPKRVKTPINALSREERSRMLALARKAQPEPLGIAVELALTTGMRRGEVCALRWSDLGEDGTITVSHALGNGRGGFYLKEPKTGSSARTIPLTDSIYNLLSMMRKSTQQQALEFGVPFGDPFILGTQEPESRPYNPTQLGKDFSAFCKMNGFDCTFHDLRHTFATMMIANGCDVRTVASYLGHASVSMTLDIYADVDPDAKKAALSKVEDSFDFESKYFDGAMEWHPPQPEGASASIEFTEEQLLAMLAAVRSRKSGGGEACA